MSILEEIPVAFTTFGLRIMAIDEGRRNSQKKSEQKA
jgi:hypothetical protein